MKTIGFSTGVVGSDSNVDRMVKAILDASGGDSEFIKLNDLNYSACKGCVWLCAPQEVCLMEDDLLGFYQKVKDADAVVLGSPIHFGTISASMRAFISRLWGFRHVNFAVQKKPFILALSGINTSRGSPDEDFQNALKPFKVAVIDTVRYSSKIPPCYRCGRHQECRIGGAYHIWHEEAETLTITPDLFRRWEDDPEAVAAVEAAAEKLRNAVTD